MLFLICLHAFFGYVIAMSWRAPTPADQLRQHHHERAEHARREYAAQQAAQCASSSSDSTPLWRQDLLVAYSRRVSHHQRAAIAAHEIAAWHALQEEHAAQQRQRQEHAALHARTHLARPLLGSTPKAKAKARPLLGSTPKAKAKARPKTYPSDASIAAVKSVKKTRLTDPPQTPPPPCAAADPPLAETDLFQAASDPPLAKTDLLGAAADPLWAKTSASGSKKARLSIPHRGAPPPQSCPVADHAAFYHEVEKCEMCARRGDARCTDGRCFRLFCTHHLYRCDYCPAIRCKKHFNVGDFDVSRGLHCCHTCRPPIP